jgi:hypothetical protein
MYEKIAKDELEKPGTNLKSRGRAAWTDCMYSGRI